jgi:prevent-host-death family protein
MPPVSPLRVPSRASIRRFRGDLAGTLRRVATDGEYVVLTKRGSLAAAVVPVGVLDLLAATNDVPRGGSRVPVRYGFRPNLATVLHRVAAEGEYVVLTRRGVAMAAVVPLVVLDLLDAAEGDLATRFLAATEDLHDLATAALDVAPRTGSAAPAPRRPRRPSVPRRA